MPGLRWPHWSSRSQARIYVPPLQVGAPSERELGVCAWSRGWRTGCGYCSWRCDMGVWPAIFRANRGRTRRSWVRMGLIRCGLIFTSIGVGAYATSTQSSLNQSWTNRALTCLSTRNHNSRRRLRRNVLWAGHLHVKAHAERSTFHRTELARDYAARRWRRGAIRCGFAGSETDWGVECICQP